MSKGHSNVYNLENIKPYLTNPEKMCIPICGGASVTTVKNLPDLALSKEEWRKIGQKAGWI